MATSQTVIKILFQHTAARRRLIIKLIYAFFTIAVSTHSRPKAAENLRMPCNGISESFNTQPPEGG